VRGRDARLVMPVVSHRLQESVRFRLLGVRLTASRWTIPRLRVVHTNDLVPRGLGGRPYEPCRDEIEGK
jgi:hypothetical protein